MPTTSVSDIEREIERKIKEDAEVRDKLKQKATQVRDYWRSIAPVHIGTYKASIRLEDKPRLENGMPYFKVRSDDPKAHLVEYGTGPGSGVDHDGQKRPQGGSSPEYAPRMRTEQHFHLGDN